MQKVHKLYYNNDDDDPGLEQVRQGYPIDESASRSEGTAPDHVANAAAGLSTRGISAPSGKPVAEDFKVTELGFVDKKDTHQRILMSKALPLNEPMGPLLLENESALEKSDEIELEGNESSLVFDANISEDNASNETIDAVRARTIGLNETASDDESVDNSSELNASITDKSAKQSVSGNDSLALNVSEGPLLLENESALEKSDEIELEENESSLVFDANISEDNASNEIIDAVRARTIGLNETASDDESVDNSSELNASITDKSAKQSVSGNDSLALNVSEGALLLENESALEKSDEIELEGNESSLVFDANISEDNASNETIDAVRARTIGLNETASDDESVDNSSDLNASITDKSAKQSVSGNDSLALNVSDGPLLLENESALEKSDEIELEENESSLVFDANISEDNASNETIDAVRARTIGLNETASDDESVDNSSELNASITDKSAKQSVSGNDSLALNVSEGALLLENESALEKSDEIELEENESSLVFDANISEDNASNETIDAVRARTIGLNETASDDESVDNSSELNASITDKSAKQSVSGNDSLALNVSEGPLLLENESALEKSDEIELEGNESSLVFDANISEDNASNETIDAERARTIGLNETASDDESVDNSSELNASITDKSDKSAKQSVSGNDSLALNVSDGPLLLENESALEKSDEIELEENESSLVFDANISEDNASNETIDAVRARIIGLNETASDDESVDNSSELNASITDKSAKQSVSGNSFALNVSEGPLLLENESALEKSDEIELEENESSLVFDTNISEDNASNETVDAVGAGTIGLNGLNETANDAGSVDNSSELNASVADKSDNSSLWEMLDENENQSVSANGSLALNISEGPLLLENESASEKSDEIELEENESSLVFDANISEDNASNETVDAVGASTVGLNETANDAESVDNSLELNASVADKSDNSSLREMLDENENQSVSANGSLALNVSEGPLLLENESAPEKSDEIELEENESSLVFDANISEDNASNETVDAVGAGTIGLNETANDAGSVDNSSELNASVADKSDNSSLWEMLDENENQSVSANGSLALNVSEGPLLLENESASEKSDETELEENESSLVFDANISEDNASNETVDAVGAGTIGLNETANDAESVDNSSELNASVADRSDNSSLWEMLDKNENQSVSANSSLALNVSEGPLLLENESASEKSDEIELEENESSLVFDANISEDNASNETVDAVGAGTIGLNETANDAESVDNSLELNASVADKSDNSSLWEMLDENENQSVSANGSLALNVSGGPLLLENESASEKSDETELEENESSLVFDANISEDNASNETVDAVGAGTIGLNETANDAESVDNSSELNASVADKSDNSSLWEMLDENENQSVSANGSLALNVSEGPLLLENESASEKSDETELEENESSLVFDANISEDNASNETVDAVGASTVGLNETANDAESVDNSLELNASVADKSDNSSLREMLDENENQSVSANGSLALNVSEGPLLLENESAPEKSDEIELEENESSLVFDANISEDNASNETVDAVGAGTIGLNETANDAGSVDNSSELNASVADKSDNSSLWEMLDENENQSVSANGSLALNVSEGPLLLENESASEKSDETELEENESSLVFDANISEDNASNETVDAVGAGTIGLNETANDAESVDNSSELNASVADRSDNSSLWEMLDKNENQSVSANSSLALNVSEGPLLLENESASEKSDEIELEENESSLVFDANISEDNASNETVDAVGAGTIGLNETANDAESVDNSLELNASVADKSDNSSLWEMLDENENQSVSANGSLALNVSGGPLLLENESASEKSDETELEENESSLVFDANISEDNASNETVDAVGAGTIGLNETANDAESVDNSSELNASVADKSDNSSLWEMLDENENQSVSANGSLALNVSEGPLLLENESASEKSDETELEENESSLVFDANISEDNASNETVDAVGAGTIGLNETANDAGSVDNSSELNASVADKSDNSSLWEMLDENENQSVSANGSLAPNVSEGPLLLENESAPEMSDEIELEENESSLVFDANISEDNASNETVDAVGAGTIGLNETANDAESVDNSLELNASVADKSDNSSLWEMLDENENQSVSANGSLALNVSEGPLLLENESASEKSDEIELEENESSSFVFDANISEDNASNETVDAVGAGTIGLNETANDAESVDNSSELNASVADKSDNSSLWEMLDENENQSVSANGSLALNASEGPLLLENETASEKSDEIELEENQSSLVFDANISEDNASNETQARLLGNLSMGSGLGL